MTDIVEQLRQNATNLDCFNDPYPGVLEDAAAEIERLREALRQFADCELHDGNCASLDVAAKRIRAIARAALGENNHD